MKWSVKYSNFLLMLMFVIIFIVIFAGFLKYNKLLNSAFENEINVYLNETSKQAILSLEKQIDTDIMVIQNLSEYAAINNNLDIDGIMKYLKIVCYNGKFKRIGIIEPNGTAYTTDDMVIDLSDRDFFKESMDGKKCFTSNLEDRISNGQINVYSSPIISSGNILGVVFATRENEYYKDILSIDSFSGKGSSYVIEKQGNIITEFSNLEGKKNISNIEQLFDLGIEENKENLDKFKYDMGENNGGYIKFVLNGYYYYMRYSPIDINDWYVIWIVPSEVVEEKTLEVMTYTIFLCLIIIVCFVILFIHSIYIQNEGRKELKILAFVDTLTEIPNVTKFQIDVRETLSKNKNKQYAIAQFDIDKFKLINDIYGYQEGNKVLVYIAKCIEELKDKFECYARESNDYFVLLIGYNNYGEIINTIEELYSKINSKAFTDKRYEMTLSMGIYEITEDNIDIMSMIDRASIARESIKPFHKSEYVFYDEKIRNSIIHEKQIENEMSRALENNEFMVFYQPKHRIEDSELIGAEALVRWYHPEWGMVFPDNFIPIFEKNGFILQVDKFVFEQVCKKIRYWLDNGIEAVPISVNISKMHLYNPNFIDEYKDICFKYEIQPEYIEFEVTESILIDNVDILLSIISKLHNIGFHVSMDDFGSGYSSLNMLKDIPVNCIKLDRVFLNDTMDNEKGKIIIESIIILAKKLQVSVVAEGVETEEQLLFLKSIGCEVAQGYYFSKPIPERDFEIKLKKIVYKI